MDILLKRYGDIRYILSLPLNDAIKAVNFAIEQDKKEKLYSLWLVKYPWYDQNTFETFEQFCERSIPKKVTYDTRSKDDIMAEILERGENHRTF